MLTCTHWPISLAETTQFRNVAASVGRCPVGKSLFVRTKSGRRVKRLWERWKRIAKAIGDFQARLILSVFYFIIVGPFALILRWAADPLSLKKGAQQTWRVKTESKDPPLKRAMNQF